MARRESKSYTKENYLKALYHLALEKGEVNINELAQHLKLKMPSVTNMVQKLADEKLLKYEKYKPVRLTDKGRKEAGLIIRKHRLTEMFLVEKMQFGWEEVHDIAEQIEHIESAPFFKKMDMMLGYPSTDPHGSPIPDLQGKVRIVNRASLAEITEGKTVRLAALAQSGDAFLKFLNSKKISLGTTIKVLKKEAFDGTMQVLIDKEETLLSDIVCRQLLVN